MFQPNSPLPIHIAWALTASGSFWQPGQPPEIVKIAWKYDQPPIVQGDPGISGVEGGSVVMNYVEQVAGEDWVVDFTADTTGSD